MDKERKYHGVSNVFTLGGNCDVFNSIVMNVNVYFILFISVLYVVLGECEPGWVAYRDQCYYITSLRYNKPDTIDFCTRRNSSVWVYKDQAELVSYIANTFIFPLRTVYLHLIFYLIRRLSFWIVLFYVLHETITHHQTATLLYLLT